MSQPVCPTTPNVPTYFCMKFLFPYFLLTTTALAQMPAAPVNPADVLARTYPADTTAEAVVLSDFGETHLDKDDGDGAYRVQYFRRTRIKILKKSGYDWATVVVPFFRRDVNYQERLCNVRGQTYNADASGAIQTTALVEKDVFEEKTGDLLYQKRFTLPNVREGSVVEFSYLLTSDNVFSLRDWRFQRQIPIRRSEYHLSLSPNFQYRVMFLGELPLVTDRSAPTVGGGVRYEWAVEAAPSFREEPFMTTSDDYLARIRFELISYTLPGHAPRAFSKTWEDFDKTLLTDEDFGGVLNRTRFLKDAGETLRRQYPDTLARLTAVHDLVKSLVSWNGQHTLWAKTGLKTVFERKTGNAAEINLLLVGLLREAGLEAHPVILSTRDHGQVPQDFPLIAWFNHVSALVPVGGRDVLLDATSPLLTVDMLPADCLNGSGRLIHLRRPRWVSLTPRQRQSTVHILQLALQPDGSLSGTAETTHAGYAALLRRTEVFAQGMQAFLQKELPRAYPACTLSQPAVENADSLTAPLVTRCGLQSTELVQQAGNRLYLTPLLTTARRENPFKSPTRTFPVDFGSALEETSLVTYTLPAGFALEEAPKTAAFALPNNDGRFTFSVSVNDNQLQVTSRLVLRKTVFTGGEYPTLRAFFDKIVAKHAEQVVLKKL